MFILLKQVSEYEYPTGEEDFAPEPPDEFVLPDEPDPDIDENPALFLAARETAFHDIEEEGEQVIGESQKPLSLAALATSSIRKITRAEDMKDWIPKAGCKNLSEQQKGMFYSNDAVQELNAKAICSVCPVLKECLTYSLERREKEGVWGGTDPRTRRTLSRIVFSSKHDFSLDDIETMSRDKLLELLDIDTLVEDQTDQLPPPVEPVDTPPSTHTDQKIRQSTSPDISTDPEPENSDPEFEPTNVQLWHDQLACIEEVSRALDKGQPRIFFQMAPSRGKTTVAAMLAKQELGYTPSLRVGFFCHTKEIQDQARARFEQIIGEEYNYASAVSGTSFHDLYNADVVFTTFQKVRYSRRLPADFFDLIFVDEGHHSHATSFREVIEYFQPANYIAMSATPLRTDALDMQEIYGPAVYQQTITDAMAEEGLLTPIHYKLLLPEETNQAKGINKFPSHQIIDLLNQVISEEDIENPRTIIYANTIEEADAIAAQSPDAVAWHNQNRRGIEKFRSAQANIIVPVSLATEGLDLPDVNILVFAADTRSQLKFIQQLGRGIRLSPNKNKLLVLDMAANVNRIRMLETILPTMENLEVIRVPEPAAPAELQATQPGHATYTSQLSDIPAQKPEQLPSPATPDPQPVAGRQRRMKRQRINFDTRPKHYREPAVRDNIETTDIALEDVLREVERTVVLPDGWIGIRPFCRRYDITPGAVKTILEDLGISELPVYRDTSGHIVTVSLNPELQQQILSHPRFAERHPAPPEGVPSVNVFAREIKVDPKTLRKRMTDLGYPEEGLEKYLYRSQVTAGVPAWLQTILKQDPYLQQLQPPPEGSGIISMNQLVKQRNIETYASTQKHLADFLAKKGLRLQDLRRYKFGARSSEGLTPELQEEFTQYLDRINHHLTVKVQPPPEGSGIVSVPQYAQNRDTESYDTIRKRLKEMLALQGLSISSLESYLFGKKVAPGLTPQLQQQLDTFLDEPSR